MLEKKRLFLAIKIIPKPDLIERLDALKHDLQHEHIKWVDQNNLHLTLKFFGETSDSKIEEIKNVLDHVANQSNSFDIFLKNIGIFGSRYDPKVVWIGIENADFLIQIVNLLHRELEAIDIFKDRQNFVPHLTLGRIKGLKDKRLFQKIINEYKDSVIQKESIKEIILYESELTRQGPIYHKLGGWDLK